MVAPGSSDALGSLEEADKAERTGVMHVRGGSEAEDADRGSLVLALARGCRRWRKREGRMGGDEQKGRGELGRVE